MTLTAISCFMHDMSFRSHILKQNNILINQELGMAIPKVVLTLDCKYNQPQLIPFLVYILCVNICIEVIALGTYRTSALFSLVHKEFKNLLVLNQPRVWCQKLNTFSIVYAKLDTRDNLFLLYNCWQFPAPYSWSVLSALVNFRQCIYPLINFGELGCSSTST